MSEVMIHDWVHLHS